MRSLDGSGGVDVWRPSFAEEIINISSGQRFKLLRFREDSILEECEEEALDGDQVLDGHPWEQRVILEGVLFV